MQVAWRINGERLMLLGWARAILMQFAHPLIAAGVYDHSAFRDNPRTAVRRLRHTVGAMLSLTFGDQHEQARAFDGIKAIHLRVHGTLPEAAGRFAAGTPYSAEDPDLVLWVHVTLMESIPIAYERLVGPLSIAERDAFCVAAAAAPVTLGARPEDVPRSWTAVRQHVDAAATDTLIVTPQARALAHALLAPPLPRLLSPATSINRLFALGDLPADIRSQYGFDWSPRDQRALTRMSSLVRTLRQRSPAIVALWPQARKIG